MKAAWTLTTISLLATACPGIKLQAVQTVVTPPGVTVEHQLPDPAVHILAAKKWSRTGSKVVYIGPPLIQLRAKSDLLILPASWKTENGRSAFAFAKPQWGKSFSRVPRQIALTVPPGPNYKVITVDQGEDYGPMAEIPPTYWLGSIYRETDTNTEDTVYRTAAKFRIVASPALAGTVVSWNENSYSDTEGSVTKLRTWTVTTANPQSEVQTLELSGPGDAWINGFFVGRPGLVADLNQDGVLDNDGSGPTGATGPYFLHSPNLDRHGDSQTPNAEDDVVNGPDDLANFFPVYLDLQSILAVLPPDDSVKYKLKQADGALNFVYTNLTQATAFDYRDGNQATGYGPGLDQPVASATTTRISADGVDIFNPPTGSPAFLDTVWSSGGGVILVEGRKFTSSPLVLSVEKDGVVVSEIQLPLLLTPGELAVDANRDGVIRFASKDASDATTVANPYRFWMNEGVDGPGSNGEETAEPGSFGTTHDYQHDRINYKRDLEDWTRLKLSIPASLAPSAIAPPNEAQSGIDIRLEWSSVSAQSSQTPLPTLKFVAAFDGTKNYLKETAAANQQIAGDQGKVIGQVDGGGGQCQLPPTLWKFAANETLEADLLFEGAAPGQGLLVAAVYRDGQRLGETGPVSIEIRRMQDLYEHWTASAADTDARVDPATILSMAEAVHPEGAHPSHFEFTAVDPGLSLPSDPEGDEYILFVHGWRMKPYERRAFAETAAKRLWQLGYRGKFGFFSWPTEWVNLEVWYSAIVNALADPDHYDRSEVVARASGHGPLAKLLVKLRQRFGAGHVHLFAHSMGNVVVSEALRALPENDPVVAQYVACQSAEVASAYEQLVRGPDGSPSGEAPSASVFLGGPDRYTYSPPIVRDSADSALTNGDNYHRGLASRLHVMANFYNGGDSALSMWDINQKLKPDHTLWPRDTAYSYDLVNETSTNPAKVRDRYREDPAGITGSNQKHEINWSNVEERHRILAFIVQARSRATGATPGIESEFSIEQQIPVNENFGFGNIHSAEFLGDAAARAGFYRRLLKTFGIIGYEDQ